MAPRFPASLCLIAAMLGSHNPGENELLLTYAIPLHLPL
jgi:hypothetical protein